MNSRPRLTYANVMVTLLAVIVLGTGTAWAAGRLAPKSVGTRQLKPAAVTSGKLRNEAVRQRSLSQHLQNRVRARPTKSVSRIKFDAQATAGATPRPIGTVGTLTLKAACVSSGGETSIVFAAKSKNGGKVQENFQNDTGSDPEQPGQLSAGNIQFQLSPGSQAIGGPPSVPSGTFFRTLANLVFTTGKETGSLQIASLVDGTAERCSVDGTALTTTG